MLIYIIHADKYYSFSLPDEVSGNYVISDYDENGFSRNLVNVVAKDNKWVMNSNENVRIISNNHSIQDCELSLHNWYFLADSQGEKILLYTMPTYNNHYLIYLNLYSSKNYQCYCFLHLNIFFEVLCFHC